MLITQQVVSTDYVKYSCVYSCLQYEYGLIRLKAEFAWVFSRKPTLSNTYIYHCKKELQAMGVNFTSLLTAVQGEVV